MLKAALSVVTFTAVYLSIEVVIYVYKGRFDIASFLLIVTNMVSSLGFEVYRQLKVHQERQARNEHEKASKIDRLRPERHREH